MNLFHVNLFWIISNFRESRVCGDNTWSQYYFLASLLIGIANVNVQPAPSYVPDNCT